MRILLKNANIYDGSGEKSFAGSVIIEKDKILSILTNPNPEGIQAHRIIDCNKHCLSPGFVDTHTHSELWMLHNRQHIGAISQGVTTEIIGQCGLSYAPLSKDNFDSLKAYTKGLTGDFGIETGPDGITVKEFRERFNGVAINTAYLLPHCAVRLETVGFDDVPLTGKAMEKAKSIVRQAMEEGAKGFSTGLSYFPASYGTTDELVELCRELVPYDGVFAPHLRTVFREEKFDCVEEALEIAQRSGCKLHFPHYRTDTHEFGNSGKIMKKIDRAMANGMDISLDLYPYHFGSTLAVVMLPAWASEGGFDKIMERLADNKTRDIISEQINHNLFFADGVISYANHNKALEGRTLKQLSAESGKSIGHLVADLLYEEELAIGYYETPVTDENEIRKFHDDVFRLMAYDTYMIGSDSILTGDNPHPRAYGAFTKMLRLTREKQYPLERMIHKLTGLPCERFHLENRGKIAEGYFADIVVFDYAIVKEKANTTFSRALSTGIEYVFVNGKAALYQSGVTGILAGRAL